MVIIVPTPPRKPGDPPPPPFRVMVGYAIAFGLAVLATVGAAIVLGGGRLY
jgi:hypothetical protein